jgi:dTDP-L-rhamnose 4-epimerase
LKERVLVTGGAGFIGVHLARKLLQAGHEVSILDNFNHQVHGDSDSLPSDLAGSVQLFAGDVRDESVCRNSLHRQTVVVHLAAETGTGQSMYRVRHYTDVNIGGTSTVAELLRGKYPVQAFIVASSRAIYGEGAAQCKNHGVVFPKPRSKKNMEAGEFDPKCPICADATTLVPTSEDAPLYPCSVYGVTKQVQEQLALMYAAVLGINGFALRYQNVYGPGQSLKNPYCGILTVFSSQARTNRPIYVFEDGQESRDFVHVEDVAEATLRCVDSGPQAPLALNVGTGTAITVAEVGKILS